MYGRNRTRTDDFERKSQDNLPTDKHMNVVIDLQGFYAHNDEFTPKEVAIVGIESNTLGHWLVKPYLPSDQLRPSIAGSNRWVTKYHHGINWDDGETLPSKIFEIIETYTKRARCIYTKGAQKTNYLKQILNREIINLEEEESCPKVNTSNIKIKCAYHGLLPEHYRCSLSNALQLRHWIISSRQERYPFEYLRSKLQAP
ncbi:hypothetical protein ORF1103 [Cotesia plutellae polydnavirus]|nr:hypothetical protein ORF1103 [Cotesia plutellae polydnavirus]